MEQLRIVDSIVFSTESRAPSRERPQAAYGRNCIDGPASMDAGWDDWRQACRPRPAQPITNRGQTHEPFPQIEAPYPLAIRSRSLDHLFCPRFKAIHPVQKRER